MTELGFVHPTPIQAATIPMALMGKDICACAATGTGTGRVGPGLVLRQGHLRGGGRGEGRSTGTGTGRVGPGLVLRQGHPRGGGRGEGRSTGTGTGRVGPGLVLRQGHPRGGGRRDLLGQVQAGLVQGWCSGKVTQGEGGGEIYWDRYRQGWSRVGAQARSPKGRGEGRSTGTGTGMIGPGLVLRQGHLRGGGGEIYWDRYRYDWSRVGAQARSPKGKGEGRSTGTGTGRVGPGLVLRQGHPRGRGRGDLLGQVQVWLVQGWCSGKVTQGEEGGGSTGTGTGMVGPGLVLRQGHPRGGGRGDLLGQVQVWLVQGWCSGKVT